MATVTPELHRQIAAAIEAILPPHREPPDDSIVVADPSSAFDRIQDWAFCEGYAFVKASANAVRYEGPAAPVPPAARVPAQSY